MEQTNVTLLLSKALRISDHYPVEVELKTNQEHNMPTRRRLAPPQETVSTSRPPQKRKGTDVVLSQLQL